MTPPSSLQALQSALSSTGASPLILRSYQRGLLRGRRSVVVRSAFDATNGGRSVRGCTERRPADGGDLRGARLDRLRQRAEGRKRLFGAGAEKAPRIPEHGHELGDEALVVRSVLRDHGANLMIVGSQTVDE